MNEERTGTCSRQVMMTTVCINIAVSSLTTHWYLYSIVRGGYNMFEWYCAVNVNYTKSTLTPNCQLHSKVHLYPNVNYTQKYTDTQMSNTPKSTPTPKCQLHPKVHLRPNANYTQKYTDIQLSITPKNTLGHPNVKYTQKYSNAQMSNTICRLWNFYLSSSQTNNINWLF
jgi:hypothetical protein